MPATILNLSAAPRVPRYADGGAVSAGWGMSGLVPVATTVAVIGGAFAVFALIGLLGAMVIVVTEWIASKFGLTL